ncbi:MAG: acetyltransferase [Balneolales bacterium]
MSKEESDELKLAEKVRAACLKAAREGYDEASQDGLCSEGAVEVAIGAIQRLDLENLIKEAGNDLK